MAKARSPRTAIFRLFEDSSQPVYVLNPRNEVIYANLAAGSWLSCDHEELIGIRADYHSGLGKNALQNRVAAICPPPDLIDSPGTDSAFLIVNPVNDQSCVANCQSIKNEEDGLLGTLIIVSPSQTSLPEQPPRHTEQARQLHQAISRIPKQKREQLNLDLLAGQGSWVQEVVRQTEIAIQTNSNVMISGEPGTGRHDLAQSIYSQRKADNQGLLVPIDCARLDNESLQRTITETIDQLRATPDKLNVTFLLNEVEVLNRDSQAELTGLIKLSTLAFDLISISGQSKTDLISGGEFDPDLVRELSPIAIAIPSLREHRDDIPILAQLFLEQHNAKSIRQQAGFTVEAIDELTAYHWPQNIKQFKEFIITACNNAKGDFVTADELPKAIKFGTDAARYPPRETQNINLDAFLAEIETELVQRTLKQAKGNKTKAAELLGITRARLHRKLNPNSNLDELEQD